MERSRLSFRMFSLSETTTNKFRHVTKVYIEICLANMTLDLSINPTHEVQN